MTEPTSQPRAQLTTLQFAAALQKGLGRAVLHARGGLNAAELAELRRWYTDSPAYDNQIELCRSGHIFRAAHAANDLPALRAIVLASLSRHAGDAERSTPANDRDKQPAQARDPEIPASSIRHQLELAALIAKNEPRDEPPSPGSVRHIIERTLAALPRHGHCFGAFNLVELDRIPGLIRAARILGSDIHPDDRWRIRHLIALAVDADSDAPEETIAPALTALRDAASTDPRIAAFLDLNARASEPPEPRAPEAFPLPPGAPFAALLEYLQAVPPETSPSHRRRAAYRWARDASETELRRAAEALDTLQDEQIARPLARIWHTERPLPLVTDAMLHRAQDRADPLRDIIQMALGTTNDPRIRAAALSLITSGHTDRFALDMLAGSLHLEDAPLIAPHIFNATEPPNTPDMETTHGICLGALNLIEAASALAGTRASELPAWAPIARWLYEATPCSRCRGDAISWLIESINTPTIDPPTTALLHEALHDSDADTQEWARKALNG